MEESQLSPVEKVVVIGGSAGSLDVLLTVLPKLKNIDTVAVVIILHRRNSDDNILEELLRMKSGLTIKEIEDKTALKPNRIHVAPADYHLLFETDAQFSLDISEKVNYSRPSIDIGFESAAEAYREKVVAILLSGANSDGSDGLIAVKNAGGTTVIQSPDTADVPFMPAFALEKATPDFVLKPTEMAALINNLTV
jgi:two-component system, chemotaxis family, protein-glutamate methylesterase/glutaminase